MILKLHRDFKKSFEKLPTKHQDKVNEILDQFLENPNDRTLRNHELKGKLNGKRAISVTGDLRIIFQEFEDYTVVLLSDVGTHSQVY